MKVVLDTNVVVSGLLTHYGVCAEIIDRMREGRFMLCVDGRILAEYADVLGRAELSLPIDAVRDFLEFVRTRAERVDAAVSAAALPDEADRPFLETALAAKAVLVTGNLRHFPKKACKGVRTLSPRQFIEELRAAT